jgi:outer membrane protein assembly factor BamB
MPRLRRLRHGDEISDQLRRNQRLASPRHPVSSGDGVLHYIGRQVNCGCRADPAAEMPAGRPVPATPAIEGGRVYVSRYDGRIYALDAGSGNPVWKFATGRGNWRLKSGDDPLIHNQVVFQSSPAVAGGVVLLGLLNGTLEARDFASGELLWDFATQASKNYRGRVLTTEGRFNTPLLFASKWREGPLVGTDRQFGVRSVFSSPLVDASVVHFGSTDGRVYAIQ